MKHLWVILPLFFILNSCEDTLKKESYSFFIAGHTYGTPGEDIIRNGLHPPFKNRFQLIQENSAIQFGIFLGDIVWESNEEDWDNVNNDLIELGRPVYFAAGNHDVANRALFELRYGDTFYHFIYNNDLFIILDPNLDNWNISGQQLSYLRYVIEQNHRNVDNVFVFFHQLLWWTPDNIYKNIKLNSIEGRTESINFWSEIEPLFHSIQNKVVMMAGDLGAGSWSDSFMYHNYDNITFIASGMGECAQPLCLGNDDGIGNDNFTIINVDENEEISYELIAINRNDINELGRLQDYILP